MANDAFSLSIEWHPQTGLFEKRDVWEENSNFAFPEEVIEDGEYKNPILNSIASGDSVKIGEVFSGIFNEPLEFAMMSFIWFSIPKIICFTAALPTRDTG